MVVSGLDEGSKVYCAYEATEDLAEIHFLIHSVWGEVFKKQGDGTGTACAQTMLCAVRDSITIGIFMSKCVIY